MAVYRDWNRPQGVALDVADNGDSISLVMRYRDDQVGVESELGMLIDPTDVDKLIAELQAIKAKYERNTR